MQYVYSLHLVVLIINIYRIYSIIAISYRLCGVHDLNMFRSKRIIIGGTGNIKFNFILRI